MLTKTYNGMFLRKLRALRTFLFKKTLRGLHVGNAFENGWMAALFSILIQLNCKKNLKLLNEHYATIYG